MTSRTKHNLLDTFFMCFVGGTMFCCWPINKMFALGEPWVVVVPLLAGAAIAGLVTWLEARSRRKEKDND